ncbi:HAD domain-containing protein [Acidovorax sp. FHTAMBA]|uniref:HAD domain-containing protein n=1 Tax=Acidovorax sp. FHTAMBA TaxID=3140252 RepID=UPI0031839FE1
MRAIFIDFDGVVHPAGGPVSACLPIEWLSDLDDILSAHPPVRIVVHSSWRLTYPHEEIREFLSGLSALEIDIVGPGEKREAITAYLSAHPEIESGLVIDDEPSEFLAEFPLQVVACDPTTGISCQPVQNEITAWLNHVGPIPLDAERL